MLAFLIFGVFGLVAMVWAVVSFLRNPRVTRADGRALAIVAGIWGLAFAAGFFGHDPAGNPFGVAAWILFVAIVLLGVVTVARVTPSRWGPVFAGMLLAGAYVSGFGGDYAAHAAGWHGESLHRYGGEMGSGAPLGIAILFSPAIFFIGVVIGMIARAVVLRKPVASA